MKSPEEFCKEIMENEALKEEFVKAFKEGKLGDFLKDNDCSAAADEAVEYVAGLKEGSVTDDDLDNVAGGCLTTESCNSCTCDDSCGCVYLISK